MTTLNHIKNRLFRTFSKDASKGEPITAKSAFEEIEAGRAVLVDVREAEELMDGGIATPALWIATSEIRNQSQRAEKFIAALPLEKKIIIYCAAGVRAGQFAEKLSQMGFRAANLGGYSDWQSAKLPTKPWVDATGQISK